MKKLLLLIKLPPPITGATMMNSRIYNSNLINTSIDCRYIIARYREDLNKSKSLSVKSIIAFFNVLFKLLRNLLTRRPEIVYFQFSPLNGSFYRDAFLGIIVKLFRIRIIFHLRVYGIENNSKKNVNKLIYRVLFKNNNVICHSKLLFSDLKSVYSGTPLILTNGLEDAFENIDLVKGKEQESIYILFLSNFLHSKGISTILKACQLLKARKLNYKLTMIGSFTHDYSRNRLLSLVDQFQIKDFVHIIGPIYGHEKLEYLLSSDIFVFPTEYEAFGNVVIEAMQASLPVVASEEGSLPIIIDDGLTGYLCPKKDEEAFADKLEILIQDKELRIRMGRAGRKKYLSTYSLDKFEKNFINTINEVTNDFGI